MIEQIIFTVTFTISFLNLLKILTIGMGNSLSLPHYKWLDPSSWFFFYPCFLYQTWFWSTKYIFSAI